MRVPSEQVLPGRVQSGRGNEGHQTAGADETIGRGCQRKDQERATRQRGGQPQRTEGVQEEGTRIAGAEAEIRNAEGERADRARGKGTGKGKEVHHRNPRGDVHSRAGADQATGGEVQGKRPRVG